MRRRFPYSLHALADRSRVAVLAAMGAWLVHQLRYTLAVGGESAAHAEAHGHHYLDFTWPLLLGAVAVALGSWVFSLRRSQPSRAAAPDLGTVWIRASLALIAIFCAQETAEGLLAPHHPQLLEGIFGSGGWIALPLSALIGGAIALALRGAQAARAVAARLKQPAVPRRRRGTRRRALAVRHRRSHVLAHKLAGRAPPLVA